MATIQLEEVKSKETANIGKFVVEVALQDALTALRAIAVEEILDQIDKDNPPTSILVDGRAGKSINEATKRVQVFFADVPTIRKAVYDCWNAVQAHTRVFTGRAAASYQLWYKETPIGHTPSACEIYLDRFNPATDYFRIVGPVVVYGRKVYWKPKGAPKFTKKTKYRFPGQNTTVKLVRIRGIMNLVEASMRRKFRYIAIAEDWVVTSALPKDGRTPGLWIGFKRKGSLLDPATGRSVLSGLKGLRRG